jgi:hypothetical protein
MNIKKTLLCALCFAALACFAQPVFKNGVLTFAKNVKLVPYTQTVKWISPEERAAKNTMTAPDCCETLLPGKSGEVKITTSFKNNSDKTFEYSAAWKAVEKGDIKERFLFLNLPLDSVKGKKFVFNNKEVPVVEEKKFAWYQLRNQTIEMTFFKGEKQEFTLAGKGKIRISCETHPKGNRVWVRIYPMTPADRIDFTVKVK